MQQSGIEAFWRSTVCGGSVLVKRRTRVLVEVQDPGAQGPRWILSDAPLQNRGRFMALSRDSDGSDEDMGAAPAIRRSGKRLRVTRRDRAQASQGSAFTADPPSMIGALEFGLTQLDSELGGPCPGEDLYCSLPEMNRATTAVVMSIRGRTQWRRNRTRTCCSRL